MVGDSFGCLTPNLYCKLVSFLSSRFPLLTFLGEKVKKGVPHAASLHSDP